VRGRKRLRKKLAKAQALLAWDRAMMRFTVKHLQPLSTHLLDVPGPPTGSRIRYFCFDDIKEEA